MSTKEFRLEIRLKNNRLIQRRLEMGYATHAALEQASGVSKAYISNYECLRENPWSRSKDGWKKSATRLAEFLQMSCEYFWPDVVRKVEKTRLMMELDAAQVMQLSGGAPRTPEELLESKENSVKLSKALKALPPRERHVIEQRFGLSDDLDEPVSLSEVGLSLNLCRERTRHLELHALGSLAKHLQDDGEVEIPTDFLLSLIRRPRTIKQLVNALYGYATPENRRSLYNLLLNLQEQGKVEGSRWGEWKAIEQGTSDDFPSQLPDLV